jgi:hypothetical protein
MNPFTVIGVNGATMPLYSSAGLHDASSGCQGCSGAGFPAALAASSSRFSAATVSARSVCAAAKRARLANAGSSSGRVPSVSSETHESAGVPPHVASTRPTGTFSFEAISRPKKYATAEKVAAVAGVHSVHDVVMSLIGTSEVLCSTSSSRSFGFFAAAISAAASFTAAFGGNPFKGISMLDCPDANQTSPTSRSLIVLSGPSPLTVSVYGPPACSGARYRLHLPRSSAKASTVCW